MKRFIVIFCLFFSFMSSVSAENPKAENVKKNDFFDLEIYLEPLWVKVKDRTPPFPATTFITVSVTPVKGAYFRVCKQTPYIVDRLIMELNKNPPTQKQLETTARSDYTANLSKLAKSVLKDKNDLFAVQMTLGLKRDIQPFQRRESRICASGRVDDE